MLPEVGELVFSFVVGYLGALEFLYVVRHLYHWGFRHNAEIRDYKSEAESLRKLQEQLKNAIAEAKEREALGLQTMKDGVLYKDGFRIDEDKKKIEELKEKVKIQEKIAERQREIEAELERQRKIEEETKQQLKKAEAELRRVEEEKKREKQKAEEEKRKAEEVKRKAEEEEKRKAESAQRKAEDEKRRAEEEENKRKQLAEEEENMKKIIAAEKKKEEEQRHQEEQKENERKLLHAEKEREEKQRLLEKEAERKKEEELRHQEEQKENERKLLQAEREREEKQRQQEIEDEKIVQKLLEAERQREIEEKEKTQKLLEAERQLQLKQQEQAENEERENTARLIAAEKEAILKQREQEENEENVRNLLKAERELELKKQEMEEEAANLQRLIEAEKEMEERQRQIDEEALQKLKTAQEEIELRQSFDPNVEADEEVFVKQEVSQAEQSVPHTIKTQYGQTSSEALKPKPVLFPGVSEESSSAEPVSSLQSSVSAQQSSEAVQSHELHFDEYERQAPDGGEDMPSLQYSDDYLRSLDGIKNKPLVREDGSGRRRAFKKRRSSGSSTSSRESRASREEELKMFTSLEEEEFENIRKGDSEYETIKYASEPNLKVGKQHRRHKRSPAKDAKRDPNEKGSLEKLNEEDPWGEVKPENYKNTDFWKREKNLSIDEEQEEFDAKQRIQSPSTAAVNIPKMSSFEEATKSQHEEAILVLQRQRSKDPEPIQESSDEESETKNVSKVADARLSPAGSNSSTASASASISPALKSPESKRENSLETEERKDRTPSPNTGLRRSPRVDEMTEYEEKWKSEDRKARVEAGENPTIEVEYASDEEPMSPEHLMEGISDFYDFNASINPSRSRSRSKSPAVNRSVSLPERRTPSPLNNSHIPVRSKSRSPSPDPASYKFIVERIIPSLDADQTQSSPDHGLSDFYDFNTKLNREVLPGATTMRRSDEAHRTSVDYVLEDLRNEKIDEDGAIADKIEDTKNAPTTPESDSSNSARTEMVYVLEDLRNENIDEDGVIAHKIEASLNTPTTPEYERSISAEMRDTEKLKEEIISGNFKRSTYVGESMDFRDEFESLREEAKTFRRSRSRSRSPVYDDINVMEARVLAKKTLQDKILEEITKISENSEQFSVEIMKNMVDHNRRASDTALIQKPEIIFQIQDLIEETDENFNILSCEPEEYHHFRRFSLGQEIPVEQYPEDYTYRSKIEIKSFSELQNLTVDLEDLQNLGTSEKEEQIPREEIVEEVYDSGSDDERQTVVEVDDEIDEDIWEYNEKPAEESHNEQSECEEADREIDRYAGRNADDWRDVEGAVGGVSDEDSLQIDEIYDEAIKNRKQSGILRDFDCILKEIQVSDEDRLEEENLLERGTFSNGNTMRSLEPGLWSPRSRSSRGSSRESSRSFIEYERRDNEMRYLADPTMSAINSTRLRSRYGIVPSTSLPTGFEVDDDDVDVNYVPKKEYNWRKNFKLDDDLDENKNHTQYLDSRKFSLGGESITLFSQSRENSEEGGKNSKRMSLTNEEDQFDERLEQEPEEIEKSPKKKKNRRKSRKGSKGSIDEDKESGQISASRDDDLTKKKNRRESKKTTEILSESASQEGEPSQQDEETEGSHTKRKSKKHRKAKDEIVLPKLDIVIPTPEKKAPPPSVAALRAALSAPPPPPEKKTPPSSTEKPKKLWEKPPLISDKQSSTSESKTIPSSIPAQPANISHPTSSSTPTSVSPQTESVSAAKENGVAEGLGSKSSEATTSSLKPSEISPLRTTASTLESSNSTLKNEEKQKTEAVKSEISENLKIAQPENAANSESKRNSDFNAKKSGLPNIQTISEPSADSTQDPTLISKSDQNTPQTLNSVMDANKQKQIDKTLDRILDSDILKDGGLYPLF